MKTIQFNSTAGLGGSGSVPPRRQGWRHLALGWLLTTLLLALPATASANTPPVANAEPDQSIYVNQLAILFGTATDADGDPIVSWQWSIVSAPPEANATLSEELSPMAYFYSTSAGDYIIQLIVSDGVDWSAPDTVTVHVAAVLPPVAIAVVDVIHGLVPFTVHFDATQSYDPQGGELQYYWNFCSGVSTEPVLDFTFETNIRCNVTLSVVNSFRLTDQATIEVEAHYTWDAVPTATPTTGPARHVVDFSASYNTEGWPVSSNRFDAVWDFGDGTSAEGHTAQHVYTQPGAYNVVLTATRNDIGWPGDTVTKTVEITVTEPAAVAAADVTTGPAPLTVQFDGSASYSSYADVHPLTYAWDFGDGSDPSTEMSPVHTFGAPGTYGVTLVVVDTFDRSDTNALEITVTEPACTAPVVGPIVAPLDPVAVGTVVVAGASFTDECGPQTAGWDWGDGTTSTGDVDPATSSVLGAHEYTEAGVYTVTLSVTNSAGLSGGQTFQYVVVFDPSGGFVTGGGWILSPAGALHPDLAEFAEVTGKATFGFVSKYQKGANVPTGNTEFQFKAGALNFKSTAYQWLVIAGARAQFKGWGTVNGMDGYGFMLTGIDGDLLGGSHPDRFRIKIW